MLWVFQRMMFGPLDNRKNALLTDMTMRERLYMAPLLVLFEGSLLLARLFPPKEGEGLLAGRFAGWGDDGNDEDDDWDEPIDPDNDPYGLLDLDDDEDPEQLAGTPGTDRGA